MPAADRVGGYERRHTIPHWPQALEDGEHPSLFGSEPWPGHLTVEDVEFLAQDQQLEVFGPRRATPEQEQAKDLSETDSGETGGHGVIVAVRREERRGAKKSLVESRPSGGTLQERALDLGQGQNYDDGRSP